MWPSVLILLYECSPLVKVLWVEELIEACHRFIVRVSEANASVGVLAFDPELPELRGQLQVISTLQSAGFRERSHGHLTAYTTNVGYTTVEKLISGYGSL